MALAILLGGCSAGHSGPSPSGSASSGASLAGAKPASGGSAAAVKIEITPADDAGQVRPDQPVQVRVSGGRLASVSVTSADGDELAGTLAASDTSWASTEALSLDTTYQVRVKAEGGSGAAPTTLVSSFTTLKPERTLKASILPQDGWTVGVGMPVVVTFNRSVTDRAAVQRALTVESTPPVNGAWHWMSGSEVQWRPEDYWPSGARVDVKAALEGIEVGQSVWGTRSTDTSFRIGSAMVSTVDVARHTMTVTRDGALLKTIPITTGKAGYETRAGTKVIISRESSRRMDAATTGVDPKDPNYYNIEVKYAMRLTWSGEFVHAAPWSVSSQGHANVSHGCTGMSTENARWLFENSKVGDVVVFTNTKRPLEWGNGYTAWNMSFDRWSAA